MRTRPSLGAIARRKSAAAIAAVMCLICAGPTIADIDPNSGIDFIRIGAPRNAPWLGTTPPTLGDPAVGRGAVAYEYSIGRFEVTTAQWTEFFNAAFDRPANDRLPHLQPPGIWGAVGTTPTTPGGQRWRVPAGQEMWPVGNISWRMAAMYCNWLHNGKGTDRSAFMDGAYDVSTFGYTGHFGEFSDQLTHHATARYWIPTWDEWLKAAHYDPDKNGVDQGGWWLYNNGTDTPLTYGPPGQGMANAGFTLTGSGHYRIPLGAYPQTQSPWGLMDVSGATLEWTEEPRNIGFGNEYRAVDGSYFGSSLGDTAADRIYLVGAEFPALSTIEHGFRIAAAIPSPSTWLVSVGCVLAIGRRNRVAYLKAS